MCRDEQGSVECVGMSRAEQSGVCRDEQGRVECVGMSRGEWSV